MYVSVYVWMDGWMHGWMDGWVDGCIWHVCKPHKRKSKKQKAQMVSFLTKPFKKMFKINRAKVVAQQNSEKNRRWEKNGKSKPSLPRPLHPPTHLGIGSQFQLENRWISSIKKGDEHPRAPVVWNVKIQVLIQSSQCMGNYASKTELQLQPTHWANWFFTKRFSQYSFTRSIFLSHTHIL